jgi:hypothetical protein
VQDKRRSHSYFSLLIFLHLDNKDLQVEPQDGTAISAMSPSDPISGGLLEEDVVPDGFGHYAENVYFPLDKEVVPGLYLIKVNGTSASPWNITLSIDGEIISSLQESTMTKSLGIQVNPPPPKCVTGVYECCADTDCEADQACAARSCVMMGHPRFTLTWFGSGEYDFFVCELLLDYGNKRVSIPWVFSAFWFIADDKDIVVTTPGSVDIYFDNPSDPVSGGVLEGDVVPSGRNFYSENVYFPLDRSAPLGNYKYLVRSTGDEEWNVTVALGEKVVGFASGTGDQSFSYLLGENTTTATGPAAKWGAQEGLIFLIVY